VTSAGPRPEAVRCVALPTGAADLLLPNIAVAEILGFRDPTPYDSAPDWLLGTLSWRGFTVPVVSVAMASANLVEAGVGQRTRVVICYTPSGNRSLPYVGIFAIGPPRLTRITPQVLEPADAQPQNPFVLHGLTYAEQPAWIPDMDAIERAVLEAIPS